MTHNVSYSVSKANKTFPLTLNIAAAVITAAVLAVVPADVLHSLWAMLLQAGSR